LETFPSRPHDACGRSGTDRRPSVRPCRR